MTLDEVLTTLKSTGNMGRRRLAAWKALRFVVPKEKRFFFEGHPKIPGQLWYRERIHLCQVITEFKPKTCFEIGTWKGGGSTLFISHGLWMNGFGKLHTIEIDRSFQTGANQSYRIYLPQYLPHVEFHLGDYRVVYSKILREMDGVDFVILDGPENADETMNQYNFFLPHTRPGTVLMAHDWFSEKSKLLKQVLENSDTWEIRSLLGPPSSLGLITAVKR